MITLITFECIIVLLSLLSLTNIWDNELVRIYGLFLRVFSSRPVGPMVLDTSWPWVSGEENHFFHEQKAKERRKLALSPAPQKHTTKAWRDLSKLHLLNVLQPPSIKWEPLLSSPGSRHKHRILSYEVILPKNSALKLPALKFPLIIPPPTTPHSPQPLEIVLLNSVSALKFCEVYFWKFQMAFIFLCMTLTF